MCSLHYREMINGYVLNLNLSHTHGKPPPPPLSSIFLRGRGGDDRSEHGVLRAVKDHSNTHTDMHHSFVECWRWCQPLAWVWEKGEKGRSSLSVLHTHTRSPLTITLTRWFAWCSSSQTTLEYVHTQWHIRARTPPIFLNSEKVLVDRSVTRSVEERMRGQYTHTHASNECVDDDGNDVTFPRMGFVSSTITPLSAFVCESWHVKYNEGMGGEGEVTADSLITTATITYIHHMMMEFTTMQRVISSTFLLFNQPLTHFTWTASPVWSAACEDNDYTHVPQHTHQLWSVENDVLASSSPHLRECEKKKEGGMSSLSV